MTLEDKTMNRIDAALADTPPTALCGDRDPYSPRVCRLPAGHEGLHEDPAFVDEGLKPTPPTADPEASR